MPAVSVVVSRSRKADAAKRSFEDALAESLRAAGCDMLLVPYVYDLVESDEAVSRLTRTSNDLVLATWLYPRTTRWALSALGIDENRIVTCHDLRTFSSPVEAEATIRAEVDGNSPEGASLHEITHPVRKRWYPVVDYSRCIGCKQCFGFCLFGVYAVESDRVIAMNPDNCKDGCPACARVCPKGAIMFPHCDDAAIAGEPGAEVTRTADPVRAVLERARRKRNSAVDALDHATRSHQPEELDDLINALENLDE